MTWLKYAGAVLTAIAIFASGYKYASALYEADIAEMREAHALALAEKEKTYRANERKQIEAYAEAVDQLEESRSNARGMGVELERVRQLADRYKSRLSQASANPCKHFSERLSRCADLLSEGAGLATEGAELSGRISAEKDFVVKLRQ